jgi:hypothetical protein
LKKKKIELINIIKPIINIRDCESVLSITQLIVLEEINFVKTMKIIKNFEVLNGIIV